jgi:AAA+ ATPase superfamily predicted ATPase
MLFDLHPKEKPESLYGRDDDLSKIVGHIENHRWISILGPRMVGKTSIAKAAKFRLQRRRFTVLYVNLWGSNSMQGLLDGVLHALQDSSKLYRKVKKYLSRIEGLNVGLVHMTVKDGAKPVSLTWQILSLLGNHADDLCIILDEVQELSNVSSHLVKLLANIFSTYSNISFCFTGSQSGLVKSLHSPRPTSPLYGRTPAMLTIKPFEARISRNFLVAGLREHEMKVPLADLDEVVSRFGGIPGWLTYYGNSVTISKLSHKEALRQTEKEAFKTAKQTLEHYLEIRKRRIHLLALKAIAIQASWSEIRRAIEANTGKKINDASLKITVDALLEAFIIEKRGSTYQVVDPVVRRYLLSGKAK